MIKSSSEKSVIGISANKSQRNCQMNVITIFLYKFLDKTIYITQSTIFVDNTMYVYLLKKALFSLKRYLEMGCPSLLDCLGKLNLHKV